MTLWHALKNYPRLFPWECENKEQTSESNNATSAKVGHGLFADKAIIEARTIFFVNRLDRGTSGLVCVAASSIIAADLSRAWPKVKKEYVCMVRGRCAARFLVDRPLTDRETKHKHGISRACSTSFELLRHVGEEKFSVLRARLERGGRKHQIRRHLNSVGHQIVGDSQHGKSGINKWLRKEFGLARIFLHAERVTLCLPGTRDPVTVVDPVCAELREFLHRFTTRYP